MKSTATSSWIFVLLAVALTNFAPYSVAQEQAVSIEPVEATTVTAKKLDLQPWQSAGVTDGFTIVDLEPGLDSILRGNEPKGAKELRALEEQNVKVTKKINEVTVSIQQGSAQGSGVIITPDGLVLTAAHVAGRPNRETTITLANGKSVKGKTLGMNRDVDAGLIQIVSDTQSQWPHATLGNVKDVRIGQWVIAAGHPGGYDSHRPPVIRIGRLLDTQETTLVTDCALIGGDSGGPLFDMAGRLIGIHSRIGIEFADNMHVPITQFKNNWVRMVKGDNWGRLPGQSTPVIGVRGSTEKSKTEAVVDSVVDGGPAARAGIRAGDTITSFDGEKVATFDDLMLAVKGAMPGDAVTVVLVRNGKRHDLRLIVGVAPDQF